MTIELAHNAAISGLVKLFKQRGIKATARSVIRGSRFLSYGIRLHDPIQYPQALSLSEALALALGVRSVAAYRDMGVVRFDVTLPDNYWATVPYSSMTEPYQIGTSPGNKPVIYNFEAPNQLIVGVPGSGKSEGIKTILVSVLRQNSPDDLSLYIIDPHRAIIELENAPHLTLPAAAEKDEILSVFRTIHAELSRRKKIGEATVRANRAEFPVVLLVIDEASEPNVLGTKDFPNKENVSLLQQIAKEGRKFRIRTLLGTQKPTEADLPGIMSIFPERYVGQVTDAKMAANFSGKSEVPAHRLTGNGDFFRSTGDGLTRFQFALCREPDFKLVGKEIAFPDKESPASSGVGGRPQLEVEPETLAYYLTGEPVTLKFAAETLGISRTSHERHRSFAARVLAKLKELNGGK